MALKLLVLSALLGLSAAGLVPLRSQLVAVDSEYDPNPQYSYAYDVQDALTGDSKRQHESRSGDVVQGSYSVNDPDGTRRTVDYAADSVNGFNAVVRREPLLQAGHIGNRLVNSIVSVNPVALSASSSSSARIESPRVALARGVAVSPIGLSNIGVSNIGLSNIGVSPIGVSNIGVSPIDLRLGSSIVSPYASPLSLNGYRTLSGLNTVALATNLGLVGHGYSQVEGPIVRLS